MAVSIARNREALVDRSLEAIGVALAVVLVIGLARPGVLQGVNWWMASEIQQAALVAGGILEQLQGSADPQVRRQLEVAVQRWVVFQQDVYPAMLSLATVAAFGVAWFGFERISGGFRSPGPIREFRFSDHLIWLLIGGLCMLVLPLGGPAFRVGENATVFMGGAVSSPGRCDPSVDGCRSRDDGVEWCAARTGGAVSVPGGPGYGAGPGRERHLDRPQGETVAGSGRQRYLRVPFTAARASVDESIRNARGAGHGSGNSQTGG